MSAILQPHKFNDKSNKGGQTSEGFDARLDEIVPVFPGGRGGKRRRCIDDEPGGAPCGCVT